MDLDLLIRRPRQGHFSAFTLIEILVVVTIMAILLTVGISNATSGINTLRMKQAIESTTTAVARARQLAMSTNREVMVRIYKMNNEMGTPGWRAIEVGTANIVTDPAAPGYIAPVDPTNPSTHFVPSFQRVGSVQRLPDGFVFHPLGTYSSLLDSANSANDGSKPVISGTDSSQGSDSRQYVCFTCSPEGRTPLPIATPWTLTVVNERDLQKSPTALPPNFATLQLEPRTARMSVTRPN